MLEIKLEEFEDNGPIKGNYYYLEVTIQDDKFTGWTKCVYSENNWNHFISELDDFLNFKKDKVVSFTGWGDEKYFSITFSFKDKAGHIYITGEVGYPIVHIRTINSPISHKLTYTIETDIISTEKFLNELKGFKKTGKAII